MNPGKEGGALGSGGWLRFRSYLLILSGLVFLVGAVFYLVYNQHRTASELSIALRDRQRADAYRYANEVEFVLSSRQDDLVALAVSEEVKGYFFSLEQGTSREYGLAASRGPIENRFASLVARKTTNQQATFRRIVLVDAQGETIAESPRPTPDTASLPVLREPLVPRPTEVTTRFAADGASVRFSTGVRHAGSDVGQIVAWSDIDWFPGSRVPGGTSDSPSFLIEAGTNRIALPLGRKDVPRDVLDRLSEPNGDGGLERTITVSEHGQSTRWEAYRIPLESGALSAVLLFPHTSPSSGLLRIAPTASMVLIGVVIIIGALLIFFLSTRSLLLKVRLEESVLRRREVEQHNQRLKTEIEERERVESALSKSQQNYREIFDATSDSILLHEPETGRILDLNLAAEEMFGVPRDRLLGATPAAICAEDEPFTGEIAIEKIWRASLEGPQLFEWRFRRSGGEVLWTEVALKRSNIGGQGCVLAVVRDTSERKRAEQEHQSLQEQLAQAQKIESIGRLAGGVAHDFNNLLTTILGHLDLLLADIPADNDLLREPLDEARKASLRAADLTRQLLAFSRKQLLHMQPLDLNQSIVGFGKMLRRLIGEHIEVSTVLNPAIGLVKADPAQIEQVILNLAVNARDAMPRGGRLTIRTAEVRLEGAAAQAGSEVRPGDYVLLEVTDTGCGMDEKTKKSVFEPFFTTKGVGQGTGLGLATIYGIVKQHNGHITFESELGHGTTFRVYLPRHGEAGGAAEPVAAQPSAAPGRETILVVEDDPAVRLLTCRMLSRSGYRVVEAGDAAEAVRLASDATPIDLLFTDVIMPRMSGREVAERIVALRPDIKVLYTSGYTDDQIALQGVMSARTHFLQKPFSTVSLTQKIRELLDAKPEHGLSASKGNATPGPR